MREVIRVERKRVFNQKRFLILSVLVLAFSIFSSISSLKNYNIYDSSGNILLSYKDNLKESKLNKHNTVLDTESLKDVVDRKDKSNYLYNSNMARYLIINFNEKNFEEITYEDINNFYNRRMLNIKDNLGKSLTKFTDDQKKYILDKSEKIQGSIQTGYAEGWKNLNNDMTDFVPVILGIISAITLPVFAEDPKTKMKELLITTKDGKRTLIKARLIAGFEIGIMVYVVSMLIFSFLELLVLGVKGYNLPIQNSINYFLSAYNITYIQQYFLNVMTGFIALLLILSITFLFTVIVEQILSGASLLVFLWIIMIVLPHNFVITHYFSNFLPYNMTNFNKYYIGNEVYTILGRTIPSILWVMIVSFIFFIIITVTTIIISNIKLSRDIK